jgi:general secretion pathway protein F
MPEYLYRAKKGPTEVIEGSVEASSVDDAVDKLDQMGLLAIKLDEVKPGAKELKKRDLPERHVKPAPAAAAPVPAAERPRTKFVLFARIRSSEITMFGRQLASLIKSGVPILRALWIIDEQTQNPVFRKLLARAQAEINNGRSLSSVLSDYPKHFSPLYIAMVRMGEDSGNLQEAMLRISDYRQRQEEILSRVRTAMAYPILMGLTGIGTIIFMLTYVIPKLTALFSSLGTNLPAPTRILMKISAVFQRPELWIAAAAILFVLITLARLQAKRMRWLWSILSLQVPVIKGFTVKSELARFARTFQLLVKSGLPILRAIETSIPVLKNEVFRSELEKAREALTGGGSLGLTLRERGVFPLFVTNLISVAEESGQLEEAMQEIADFYERETDEQIRIMTSLMEPLMILVMGVIVGFIVMAMMLPMFELNMIVK